MGEQRQLQRQRKIIHCDCDCFYVSVEMRDDPLLRGRPVAVGGASDRRGVISTCNYEAREFGVRSAMPSVTAKRLCPDLLILPTNMEKYRRVSQQIRAIFFNYTDLVEPLSLDEAFLDVTESTYLQGSGTLIAEDIRRRVKDEVGITLSAGVAPNKYLAKIASDWNKPDGIKVIRPEDVTQFVFHLPVTKIFGVGKVTAQKLRTVGIETCGDLEKYSIYELTEKFGRFGRRLYELARGFDERPVETQHIRKSLSVERTYAKDLDLLDHCLEQMPELFIQLKSRLRRVDERYLIHKIFVKLKFSDFSATTLERVGNDLTLHNFKELCRQAHERGNKAVRLLGIGVRFIDLNGGGSPAQLSLFEE